jgi:hypothetical protein
MRNPLIGAAVLGFCLIASPVFAQGSAATANDKPPTAASGAAPPSPQTPAKNAVKNPEDIAHQAMVEEQERRDRAAEAERDRDDQ